MLATTQSGQVAQMLRDLHPGLTVDLARFTTRGDRSQAGDRPISEVGTKGLFTAELEEALRDGRIDLAVHSAKDLPAQLADGTDLPAWPRREDPRDALIVGPTTLSPGSLQSLAAGALVGTSSPRRAGQILHLRPDLKVAPIRGNIETRIRKVREGQYAATLLAVAGLKRAGLLAEIAQVLDIRMLIPAAGQGVLALQARADDARVRDLLAPLDDPPTRLAVTTEREVVRLLGAGCNMPLGVHAWLPQTDGAGEITAVAALCHPSGRPCVAASAQGRSPADVAAEIVEKLLAGGGGDLLGSADA
ncbi:MAG: Porphobilinogen deaminase [Phycisphaerae bacterium]|nr:Porphobilinogen deaminase [Phycisphaerae bacterium]